MHALVRLPLFSGTRTISTAACDTDKACEAAMETIKLPGKWHLRIKSVQHMKFDNAGPCRVHAYSDDQAETQVCIVTCTGTYLDAIELLSVLTDFLLTHASQLINLQTHHSCVQNLLLTYPAECLWNRHT